MYILNTTLPHRLTTQFPSKKHTRILFKNKYHIQTYKKKQLTVSNSINENIHAINSFVDNDSWKLVSHGIVNFSVLYFSLNWMYYRTLRIKAEKRKKDDDNK